MVAAPNAAVTAEDVIAVCRKYVTAYQVPKHVQFTNTLPKTAVGKVLRRALRDEV